MGGLREAGKGPEAPKKSGCGGCLGVLFWLGLVFCLGWYTCNLEHSGWDFKTAAGDGLDRVSNHAANLWRFLSDKAGTLGGGGDSPAQRNAKAVPPIPNTIDWVGRAAESQRKAEKLLESAGRASGEEKERFLRMAQVALQSAYEDYVKAEQLDRGNQDLTRRIAILGEMLKQYKPR